MHSTTDLHRAATVSPMPDSLSWDLICSRMASVLASEALAALLKAALSTGFEAGPIPGW